MPNSDLIRGGTASVTAGQTSVNGQNVSWSNVIEGDFFGAHVGLAVPIAAVAGPALTLAYPWPGPTQNAAAYAIQPKGDTIRFGQDVRTLLANLTNGTVAALAAAGSAADKIAYYTGAGVAALTNFPTAARNYIANFFTPVEQGGGPGQLSNKIRIGWTAANHVNVQVDGFDQGSMWTDSYAPSGNGWFKLPNNWIVQQGNPVVTVSQTGTGIVTLPTAFQSAGSYVVTLSNGDSSINVQFQQLAGFGYPSAAQFAFQAIREDGSNLPGGNVRLSFIAIGK